MMTATRTKEIAEEFLNETIKNKTGLRSDLRTAQELVMNRD